MCRTGRYVLFLPRWSFALRFWSVQSRLWTLDIGLWTMDFDYGLAPSLRTLHAFDACPDGG